VGHSFRCSCRLMFLFGFFDFREARLLAIPSSTEPCRTGEKFIRGGSLFFQLLDLKEFYSFEKEFSANFRCSYPGECRRPAGAEIDRGPSLFRSPAEPPGRAHRRRTRARQRRRTAAAPEKRTRPMPPSRKSQGPSSVAPAPQSRTPCMTSTMDRPVFDRVMGFNHVDMVSTGVARPDPDARPPRPERPRGRAPAGGAAPPPHRSAPAGPLRPLDAVTIHLPSFRGRPSTWPAWRALRASLRRAHRRARGLPG
jgi:hypothetical protein